LPDCFRRSLSRAQYCAEPATPSHARPKEFHAAPISILTGGNKCLERYQLRKLQTATSKTFE
jgi:hypothetical protein